MKAIILGSSRGVRRLDPNKSYPYHLSEFEGSRRALDWILQSFQQLQVSQVCYVGGYHIEKVIENYPDLKYHFYADWMTGSDVDALGCAIKELTDSCYICSADIVFHREALDLLSKQMHDSKSDFVLGVDGPVNSETPFAGVALVSAKGSELLQKFFRERATSGSKNETDDLVKCFSVLSREGAGLSSVDISSKFASLSKPKNAAKLILGTKAQTLQRLQPVVRFSKILDQFRFAVSEWKKNPQEVVASVKKTFNEGLVVVRSSALSEDAWSGSQAGRFKSILNVDIQESSQISDAITEVFNSFPKDDLEHQIFVQPQVLNVTNSGVILTRDLETNAPYLVINCDTTTSRTDTITSGSENAETWVVSKQSKGPYPDKHMHMLIAAARELESLIDHDALDIEFAIDRDEKVYILQVRPLTVDRNRFALTDDDFAQELALIRDYSAQLFKPNPAVSGTTTVLGIMPDWNPAEIIGTCPKPLALSLYQRLITDSTWAKARALIGYKDVTSAPLLVALLGRPYIDVRASVNSFLPQNLESSLSEKLVNHYIGRLKENPELHDKIEFHIVPTCLTQDFKNTKELLSAAKFSDAEIKNLEEKLKLLTQSIIQEKEVSIASQMQLLEKLNLRREQISSQLPDNPHAIAIALRVLSEDCINWGTLPFSILARYAFVALAFLKSFVSAKILSDEEYDEILRNISTVASQMSEDFELLAAGQIAEAAFVSRYAHLRPDTYDILSENMGQALPLYIRSSGTPRASTHKPDINKARQIFESKFSQIDKVLKDLGLNVDVMTLMKFILEAIPARESSKFEFTKNLNLILMLTEKLGQKFQLSRDDMAFVSIETLIQMATNGTSSATSIELQRAIGFTRKRFELTKALHLPPLISDVSDFDFFSQMKCQPNFITHKRVVADCLKLDKNSQTSNLNDKIILLERADPGYDWIFSYPIAGIITKYGGVASHMAIRAAEFGLPAAIGCGEMLFDKLAKHELMELDCGKRQIRILK
ncbi:MAG: PEP/pyruvate-binding domain-containing protein [Oligoflexia bacterium]|nr:PEP/pyruvate-binding domain-containing protein [Oligoflexia bacterium]